MRAEPNLAGVADELSDQELVLNFESVGANCELGPVQRLAGAEPLGLPRFASMPVAALVPAPREQFAGLADPANVAVEVSNGEYMIRQRRAPGAGGATPGHHRER